MGTFIDRRLGDGNKNRNNRNKFLRRIDDSFREGVRRLVNESDIEQLLSNKRKKISIPGKGLEQPQFVFKKNSGNDTVVTTGNGKFKKGDKIDKPSSESSDFDGEGGNGGEDGDGDGDALSFLITKDEYLDILFEELELPDMIKKQLDQVETTAVKRAGFSTTGIPARLSIVRSVKHAKGRKLAFSIAFQNIIIELEKQLEELLLINPRTFEQEEEILRIQEEIESLKKKIDAIPFLQENDLRYSRFEMQKMPVTKAVMFAIMDVSGSMGPWDKEMAKRFFLLMALFIERQYEHMEIVWIVHTNEAWEVTSKEFFESSMTGGTHASSAFALAKKIIDEKYNPNSWNIFMSQISDGDNAVLDTPTVMELLTDELLPMIQYLAYAETRRGAAEYIYAGYMSELTAHYKQLEEKFKNIKSSVISDVKQIYPIFRKLFEKKK